jgi:hypothetical protein
MGWISMSAYNKGPVNSGYRKLGRGDQLAKVEVSEIPVFRENGTIETVRKQAKKTKIAEAQFADRCHA